MIGRHVANYRIEKLLGEGGMGSVYLVRHRQLPNTVAALKVIRSGAETPMITQRFVQEALVAATIGGHRVARPLDLGRFDDGAPYILMELIEGRTLAARLADGPLDARTLVAIGFRIADTMAVAHARSIIHRDLKPSNVMLVGPAEDRVKLLDFGVARATGALRLADTREAAIVGSPGYLSPEAASGGAVDAQTDVFSLGVVLFKMATGELPFRAGLDREAVAALLTDPAPAPSARRPAALEPLPDGLDALIVACLAKDPADRPTMSALRDRLGALHGTISPDDAPSMIVPIAPAPPPAPDPLAPTITHVENESDLVQLRERVEKFAQSRMVMRRRTRTTALIASASIVVAAVLGVMGWRAMRSSPAVPAPLRAADLTQHARTFRGDASSRGLSPDGKTLAYTSQRHLFLVDLDSGKERDVATAQFIGSARWSPGSKRLVVQTADGTGAQSRALSIDRETGNVAVGQWSLPEIAGPTANLVAVWSPPWKWVEIRDGARVRSRVFVGGDYDWLIAHDWSPDGTRLLVATEGPWGGALWTIGADGLFQHRIVDTNVEGNARFVSNGRGVIYAAAERDSTLIDLQYVSVDGGPPRTLVTGLAGGDFTLSRDDRRLAYTRAQGARELWLVTLDDAATPSATSVRRVLADSASKKAAITSPDGTMIAYVADDGVGAGLFTIASTGGPPRRIETGGLEVTSVAWSPDGQALAYLTSSKSPFAIWTVPTHGGAPRKIVDHIESDIPKVYWSPARSISYERGDNRAIVRVDPDTGRSELLPVDHGWLFDPLESPDGRWVAVAWNPGTGPSGLFVLAPDGSEARRLANEWAMPIAWSRDSTSLDYVVVDERFAATDALFHVSMRGGDASPRGRLPIDRLADCTPASDGVHVACTAGAQSDVWVIDDFDHHLRDDR